MIASNKLEIKFIWSQLIIITDLENVHLDNDVVRDPKYEKELSSLK